MQNISLTYEEYTQQGVGYKRWQLANFVILLVDLKLSRCQKAVPRKSSQLMFLFLLHLGLHPDQHLHLLLLLPILIQIQMSSFLLLPLSKAGPSEDTGGDTSDAVSVSPIPLGRLQRSLYLVICCPEVHTYLEARVGIS